MTRAWLWPANVLAMLATAAAAILQPVMMLSVPCGRDCDPHGYVAIFSVFPAVVVVIIALVAVALLTSRSRAGFGTALAAAVGCAGMLYLLGAILVPLVVWLLVAVVLTTVSLAIAGLRSAPARSRPRLPEPPYPHV